MKLSNLGALNLKDFAQGLILAVLAAIVTYLIGYFQTGNLSEINIKEILTVAVTALITYISKRYLSNSDGEFLKKEKDPYESESQ